jgi:hypothetical protein
VPDSLSYVFNFENSKQFNDTFNLDSVYAKMSAATRRRRACRVLGQSRATQRYLPEIRDDEEPLMRRIIELAALYGRYGTPRVTALLHNEGWEVNHKRVERIWRQQGLKVPKKLPKRGRLWFNDGSCVRLRPLHKDHVWAYEPVSGRHFLSQSFVTRNDTLSVAPHNFERSKNGRQLKIICIIDE